MAEAIPAISSSIWMKCPPLLGSSSAITSAISVEGVIGYPPKKLQPAKRAPCARAVLPCQKANSGIRIPLFLSILLLFRNRYRKVRTNIFALAAAYAIVFPNRRRFQTIAQLQHRSRTNADAQGAPLAPCDVDPHPELFFFGQRQQPPRCLHRTRHNVTWKRSNGTQSAVANMPPRQNATAEPLRPDAAQKASLSFSLDGSARLTNNSRSSERSMIFFSVSLLPNRSREIATLGRTRSFP